jgi:hypothetical protein
MYDPMDFFDTRREPSYARKITPILFGSVVFLDDEALAGRSTYDSRQETDKIDAWLTRLHGPAHNMYTESVEPGKVWLDAHHGEYQFMWPGDAARFRASMVVVDKEAQYDSSGSRHDRTFRNYITGQHNLPKREQFTVEQVLAWVSEHCGTNDEPGQYWTNAGYIFLFENPDHRFEFKIQFS